MGGDIMRCKKLKISFLLLLSVIIFVGCSKEDNKVVVDFRDSAQTVVEKHFQYNNEKNKTKLLTTLTEHWNAPNVDWGFENLNNIKIVTIEEEKSDTVRRRYLNNGRGSIYGTAEENLKVYKAKYEVKYKKDGIGPQNSGTYVWWYFVIRKDENSPWLIDDYGV
jgi:PBP1b-binding outer membrane lipoprotein LpoB